MDTAPRAPTSFPLARRSQAVVSSQWAALPGPFEVPETWRPRKHVHTSHCQSGGKEGFLP